MLHEKREDLQALNKLKFELGEYNFAAQYQQSPNSNKDLMIKKHWLQFFSNFAEIKFTQIIQSWDTAIKAKDEHDYSVGITIGVNENNYYILDLVRAKLEFLKLTATIESYASK